MPRWAGLLAQLVVGGVWLWAGPLTALLQPAFVADIALVWARGVAIDCGCFGDGGPNPDTFSQHPWEIARDVGLLLASLLVVWVRRTPLSLDQLLTPEEPDHQSQEERRVGEVT